MRTKFISKYINNRSGFTLVELMLVIALLAISVGVTNDILISIIRSQNKTQVSNEIEQQANFISLKIEKELRNARSIVEPIMNEAGMRLVFQTRSGVEIEYEVNDSGIITRSENGGASLPVTSNHNPGGVLVQCIEASQCFSVSGVNPQIVNIRLKFNQSSGGFQGRSFSGDVTIDSTIVIRNTY